LPAHSTLVSGIIFREAEHLVHVTNLIDNENATPSWTKGVKASQPQLSKSWVQKLAATGDDGHAWKSLIFNLPQVEHIFQTFV
jgi:hypothetical protein